MFQYRVRDCYWQQILRKSLLLYLYFSVTENNIFLSCHVTFQEWLHAQS